MRRIALACLVLVVSASQAFAVSPWVHMDWQYRVPFEAEETRVAGTDSHADFAMLVLLDGTRHGDVFANAKSDGSDLLFTTAAGATILEREVVSYDPIGETAEIWVRVPALSKAARSFYLYYDNPLASLEASPNSAWSDAYRAVYHFEEDPADLVLTDSSPAEAHAFLSGSHGWTSGDAGPGKVGRGWHLNGTTHHISTNAISTADSSYTVEAWLTHDYESTDFFFHANPGFWHVSSMVPSSDTVDYAGEGLAVRWNPQPIPIQDPHHHYLWEFDAIDDTIRFYYDGQPQSIRSVFPPDWGTLYTGRLINPNNAEPVGVVGPMYYVVADFHSGKADEFRLREGRASADRILTEFNNADDNPAFFSFGATESIGATGGIADSCFWMRSFPNPSSGPSSIRYAMPQEGPVRLAVYDVAGRRVASLVDHPMPAGTWIARWDGRTDSGAPAAAGVYFLRLSTPSGVRTNKLTLVR